MVPTNPSDADVFGKFVADLDVWASEHSRNAALSDLPMMEQKDGFTRRFSTGSLPAYDLRDHEREIIDDVRLPQYHEPLKDSHDPSEFFGIKKNMEWRRLSAPLTKLPKRLQALPFESRRPTLMRRSKSEQALRTNDISSQVPSVSPLSRAVLKRHSSIGGGLSQGDNWKINNESVATLENRKIKVQGLLDEQSSSDSSLRRMQGSSSSLEQTREKARDELTSTSDHTGFFRDLENRRWTTSLVQSNQETKRPIGGNGKSRRRSSNSSVTLTEATLQAATELQDELRKRDQVVILTKSTETSYKSRRRRHLDNLLSASRKHGGASKHTEKRRSSMGELVHSPKGIRKLKCLDAAIASPQRSVGSISTISELQDIASITYQNEKKVQDILTNFEWQKISSEPPPPRKVEVTRSPRLSRRRQSTTDTDSSKSASSAVAELKLSVRRRQSTNNADSIISAGGAVAELKLSERNHLKESTPNIQYRSARRWSGTSLSSRGWAERCGMSPRGPTKKISVCAVENVKTKCQELDMRF